MNEINPNYLCPISRDIMINPVKASCGHIFNHRSIEIWLYGENKTCPIDRKPISSWNAQKDLEEEIHTFIHLNPLLFENKDLTQLKQEQDAESTAILKAAQVSDFSRKDSIYRPGVADFIIPATSDRLRSEENSFFQIDPSILIENLHNNTISFLKKSLFFSEIRGPVEYTELRGLPVDQFVKDLIARAPRMALLSMLGETTDEFTSRNENLNEQEFGLRIITHTDALQIIRLPTNTIAAKNSKNLMILHALAISVIAMISIYINYNSEKDL